MYREEIKKIMIDVFDKTSYSSWFYKDEDDEDFVLVATCKEVEEIEKQVKKFIADLPTESIPYEFYCTVNFDHIVGYVNDQGDWGNWGFMDEYNICDGCNTVIRTSPDSYNWVANYIITDDGLLCEKCLRKNPEFYLDLIMNDPNKANTVFSPSELERMGFKKLGDTHETGWYGVCESPTIIFNDIENKYDNIIFHINSNQQFTTFWSIYVK